MSSTRSLLPIRESIEVDSSPSVLAIETAGDVLASLSSENARRIVSRLYAEPATASEIARTIDSTLQTVQYHLEQLQAVGLIDVVDTWYSAKGTEMKVYGPTATPLVICAGEANCDTRLRNALEEGG